MLTLGLVFSSRLFNVNRRLLIVNTGIDRVKSIFVLKNRVLSLDFARSHVLVHAHSQHVSSVSLHLLDFDVVVLNQLFFLLPSIVVIFSLLLLKLSLFEPLIQFLLVFGLWSC